MSDSDSQRPDGHDSSAVAIDTATMVEPSSSPRVASRTRAADALSERGPARMAWLTPMLASAARDGGYLRAMLGNAYFLLPAAGLGLGVAAGVSTSGLAVPPSLTLTLVLIVIGALDALSGFLALAGFAIVTILTGNLLGSHMLSAPPGEQTAIYTLTGLFALGVMWFAGAQVPHRLRPLTAQRTGSTASVWLQRLVDAVVMPLIGTLVIWLAAWQMPTLTGNAPQELFVTIQNHLGPVKVVAFVAILARVLLQTVADQRFAGRQSTIVVEASAPRLLPIAILFWLIRGAFALMILWEYLGFTWMTWMALALFLSISPLAWAGRRLPERTLLKSRFPLNFVRILIIIVLAELLLSQLTRHLVNPNPMLGGMLIGVGILLALFAFFQQAIGTGLRTDTRTVVADVLGIALVLALADGAVGIGLRPFSSPHGVFVAPTGAVFIADTSNNRVILDMKNGFRETVGVGLSLPSDVVADPGKEGYVYIADAGNNRIVRLSGYNNYSVGSHTFNLALAAAGTQASLGVGLKNPQSVSLNGLGNLVVADTGNGRVVEINRNTLVQTTLLTGLKGPLAVLCDPFYTKTVYVANTGAGTVIKILPNGTIKTIFRGLHQPAGLAQDPWGNFYVSQMGTGTVLQITPTGKRIPIETGLGHPRGLSVDALGNVFVADASGGQVKVVATLREHQLQTHGMPDPSAVAYAPSGAIYVTEAAQGWLQVWNHGTLRTVATGLDHPIGVAVGANGVVWVDTAGGRLVLVRPDGKRAMVTSGIASPRQLSAVLDASGSVLVVEGQSGKVVQVTPSGITATRLSGLVQPVAVAEDAHGNYVVAQRNGAVIEILANGKRVHLYNLRGITAIAMDAKGNSYAASSTYRLVVMHVAATGRDVVVNRDFRSITGMSASPKGVLWIADKASLGLFKVEPTATLTQL